jgi:proteasome activator subunit 4
LMDAMFDTLPGLDANDPNKTLATLQLYCSVLSSVGVLGAKEDGASGALAFDWSKWIDEFLSRIFVLLVNLEPSITTSDTEARDRFLTDTGSQYRSVVDILFSRVEPSLYKQVCMFLPMIDSFLIFCFLGLVPGSFQQASKLSFGLNQSCIIIASLII